ncbi:MAG: tripartite tricarboxylate transporter TctB family protein [Nitrospirae bacterium]|nr:tripartite tricarboxylate transporter TctB family protein [Nitrospirota bacterium]
MAEKGNHSSNLNESFSGALLRRASFSGSLLFALVCLLLLFQATKIIQNQPEGQLPVTTWPDSMLIVMILISLGKAVGAFVTCRRERRCPPEEVTPSLFDEEMAEEDGLGILGHFVEKEVKEAAATKEEVSATGVEVKRDYKIVVGIALVLLFYVLLIDFIGFALANVAFMASFLVVTGERKLLRLVLIPLISTAAFLYMFVKVIYVSLPLGMWFFDEITVVIYKLLRIY